MLTFSDRDEFLKTVNQWIRDGSNLESFSSSWQGESVTLRGADGATEELYYFFEESDKEEFDDDTSINEIDGLKALLSE